MVFVICDERPHTFQVVPQASGEAGERNIWTGCQVALANIREFKNNWPTLTEPADLVTK